MGGYRYPRHEGIEMTKATFWDFLDTLLGAPAVPQLEAPAPEEETARKVKSRIRITFNRKLTYSEREQWRRDADLHGDVSNGNIRTWFNKNNPAIVWIEDYVDEDTRDLYEGAAEYVSTEFVNVHPKYVFSDIPRVRV